MSGTTDYRGGCRPGLCPGDEQTPGCARSCGHRRIVQDYRDARHAWEALRESDTPVTQARGSNGGVVACYQLDEEEFRELFPPPTFRAWLEGQQTPTE